MFARFWKYSAASLATFVVFAPSAARADDASGMATARAIGTEGVMLAEQGRCVEAIPKLERAELLYHAPTTAAPLGECYIQIGKLVMGTEMLQRLVREPPTPNRPAFTVAVARAQKVLDETLPRIGALHVSVQSPAGASKKMSIDGEVLSDAFFDVDRPTDPGRHTIQVTAPGYLPASAEVTVKEADVLRVQLKLEPDPNAPVVADSADAKSTSTIEGGRSKAPAVIAYGFGVAGVAVGAAFGLVASGKASDAESKCPNRVCVSGSEGARDLDNAKSSATISTVGFVVGGVGVATGTVLLLLARSSSSSSTASASARIEPRIGVGFAGLGGSF